MINYLGTLLLFFLVTNTLLLPLRSRFPDQTTVKHKETSHNDGY